MGKSNERTVVSNVTSGNIVPAAPGWKVHLSLKNAEGKDYTVKHLIAAFCNISSEDGRNVLTPIVFNTECEGLTLPEIEADYESAGYEVVNTMMYCDSERAINNRN